MASDMAGGADALQAAVKGMESGEIDLLIGTQIMAKGYHFPRLTLVGVVDADLGLTGGDPRAAERTFQLLHQVAGRSGRADRAGRVMLQTYMPDHPVMKALASSDRDGFFACQRHEREAYSMPPFGRMASVILSGVRLDMVDAVAWKMAEVAPKVAGVTVLGPAPAPLAILRGRHRRRFLVRAGRDVRLQPLIAEWLGCVKIPSAVRVQIDIDPYSFL